MSVKKILKTILRRFVELIFNDWIIEKFVTLYKHVLEDKVRKAIGNVTLKSIKSQGVNCKFQGDVKVYYSDGLQLGDDIRIGFGSFLFALGGISIGNNTQISRNVVIYSANHEIEGKAIPYDDQYVLKPVKIGESVWIGMNVLILPGVTIGDGAVIGMGTVVSKDVKPGEIIVGSGQRVIKHRDLEKFNQLDEQGQHFAVLWPDR
ncbi:MAG: acyltransferase [Colwellia sp.]|nr:acyltransferase [Colwellia sp.]